MLALLLILFSHGTVFAGTLEDLARDLKPLNGYVVLPVQGEFLIDLDGSQGVAVGDLFTVIQPGEKITHPVSGAILGSLDIQKGLLQVTQVKAGFSHARPLAASGKIERGDQIRRFDNLRAAFWDYTGKGEAFFAQVKETLPALNWQDYAASQSSKPAQPGAPEANTVDLVLILDGANLTVRDANFGILHTYPAPNLSKPIASTSAPYQLEEAAAAPVAGVRYEATFPGFKSLGALGFPVVTADFTTIDGRLLLAASDGKTIKLLEVGESLSPLGETTPSDLAQVLTLSWWQPAEKQAYLAVNGWKDKKLSSMLYRFADGRLTLVNEFMPYLLGSFDRDGNGRKELLLTQNFDRDMVWGAVIKKAELKGNDLSLRDAGFELPRNFSVGGSLMADITGNGQPETIFVRDGLLYIYSGEKRLYKSPKMMGGTLSRFIYEEQPHARETEVHYAAFEVPPVATDLDGDGQLELLAVSSDTGALTAPGIDPGVSKSRLSVLKKRDGMYVKGTLGEELEVPLQGLTVAGDRVLFVATETGSVFGKGGESQVLVFPLAR